jgi:hypothetical protein
MMKSGVTGRYAIPPQTSARCPQEYLERTISEIKEGEHVVEASALAVDVELNWWLRPDICIGSDSVALSSSLPCVTVTRDALGFAVASTRVEGSDGSPDRSLIRPT